MKNVGKMFLLVVLAGAGYFIGYQEAYAACGFIPGTTVYNCDLDGVSQCDQAICNCGGGTIINTQICSLDNIAPGDGKTQLTEYGVGCGDLDGCICPDGTDFVAPSCVAPVVVTPVIAFLGSPSVAGRLVTFSFSSDKIGTVFYVGSCGAGSISNAVASSNTVVFNLPNITKTYNDCKIYIQDSLQAISNILTIPSFSITATVTPPTGGGGGGGSSSTCSDIYLTCTNGIYTLKTGYYCVGGDLGKTCSVSIGTGVDQLLEIIKEEKSVVYEYTPQGVKIRIFVPKYKQWLIRKAILSLNRSLYKAINKKLLKVTDPSYMIENFENLTIDSKILVYKEIGSITKLYNDFLGLLYLVLDMKQRDYLPLARTYLENYFKEFAKFQK